jgi:uncharacterized protein YndB with AHSA1/START domain
MSVSHASFTIERTYGCTAAQAFSAFSDPDLKRRWFAPPDEWSETQHELDFRVGGREVNAGRDPAGRMHRFRGRFHDIVDDERIVYAYDLHLDDRLVSVSLATVELQPDGARTRLALTEHGAFFDELEDPSLRKNGTGTMLNALGRLLDGPRIH